MAVGQGIARTWAYKVQSALNVPATGSGGQLLRRTSIDLTGSKETYSSNEIVSHQQSTGATHGVGSSGGTISAAVSATTYGDFLQWLCRKDWAATTAISALSITIAASGSNYTVTRAAGDFLTGGIKVGDVIRLTGGSFNANNVSKNLVVLNVTATVLTVNVLNGETMTAEGPIASSTVTVSGKKTWTPTSGHTNKYITFEDWSGDLTRSQLFADCQVTAANISAPATGIITAQFPIVGLSPAVRAGAQVLTTPTAETATSVMSSARFAVYIATVRQPAVTSFTLNVNGNITLGEAVVGSNSRPDTQRGRIAVDGSFTALFESDTLAGFFDAETAQEVVIVMAEDATDDADCISFSMPATKFFGASGDDGEKQLMRTYPFTAQRPAAAGTGTKHNDAIVAIQDSTIV
jgi:Phage tail tube protein